MQIVEKVNETSSMAVYRIKNRQTVENVLASLNLEAKFFAVLVNGKKVDLKESINEGDEILVLPKIAGG